MNITEATALVGTIKALCPSQQIDTYAAEAWEMALYDIAAGDAAEAVKRLIRRELEPGKARYIEPGHIRGEVRRLRAERINKHPQVEPPPGLSAAEFIAWQRDVRERIASGVTIEAPAVEARRLPELGQVTKGVA